MIIIGYSGQVSIGQSFFFGMGAYVTAWLGVDKGWPFLLTLPVSAALGLLVGFVDRHPGPAHPRPLPGPGHPGAGRGVPRPGQAARARGHHRRRQRQAGRRHRLAEARLDAARHVRPGLAVPGAVRHRHRDVRHRLQHDEEPARPVAGGPARQRGRRRRQRRVAGRWKTGAFAISAAYGAVGGSMLVFITRIAAPETGGFTTAIALLTGRGARRPRHHLGGRDRRPGRGVRAVLHVGVHGRPWLLVDT